MATKQASQPMNHTEAQIFDQANVFRTFVQASSEIGQENKKNNASRSFDKSTNAMVLFRSDDQRESFIRTRMNKNGQESDEWRF